MVSRPSRAFLLLIRNPDGAVCTKHVRNLGHAGIRDRLAGLAGTSSRSAPQLHERSHRLTVRMRRRSVSKNYIASVRQPEGGTYEYVYNSTVRNRRKAEDAAREAAAEWGGTLVGLSPARYGDEAQTGHRLFVIAASTLVVGGTTIATAMTVGLALEGAL